MKPLLRSIIGAAVAGIALAGLAFPAAAAPAGGLSFTARVGPDVIGDIAGYDFVAEPVMQASATIVIPNVRCRTTGTQALAFGLGDEVTTGSPTSLAVVFVACTGTTRSYKLATLANGQIGTVDSNVGMGDTVQMSYTVTGTKLDVDALDVTTGGHSHAVGTNPTESHMTYGAFPLFTPGGGNTPVRIPEFIGAATFSQLLLNEVRPTGPQLLMRAGMKVSPYRNGGFKITR